jgi:exosome complex component RRP41
MGGTKSEEPLIVKGKRTDGRKPDEMRPIKIEAGVLKRADGSAYVEIGGSHALAAVYGPREMHPRHKLDPQRAVLRTRYEMAPFSVGDRKRPGPDRRSTEISKVTREALEPVIPLEDYPKTVIDVFIEILQADAGTRVTGITAAAVALADAGIQMKDLIASCAAGKIEDTIVLDLSGIEDNCGSADVPVAYSPKEGKITLLQMDGLLTEEEFDQALKYAIEGCKKIYEEQKKALKNRYKKEGAAAAPKKAEAAEAKPSEEKAEEPKAEEKPKKALPKPKPVEEAKKGGKK